MSKILWKMIGVETKVNGLNEVEYTLECSYGARDVLYMLYVLGSILVLNVVSIIALNDGGIISVIGAMLTLVATVALIPVIGSIIEGYYSAYKVLW